MAHTSQGVGWVELPGAAQSTEGLHCRGCTAGRRLSMFGLKLDDVKTVGRDENEAPSDHGGVCAESES